MLNPCENEKTVIKVAMADDHNLIRAALARVIEGFENYSVIIQVSNGIELLEKLAQTPIPDLLLLDINMPKMDGIATAREVSSLYPEIKILALSMLDNENAVIGMIKNGARGYILKDAEPAVLKQALDNIVQIGYHYSERVTGRMIHALRTQYGNLQEGIVKISERELTFLKFVCTELTYKEIAEKMEVSHRTVDSYRDTLFEKLGVKSRVGLAMYAVKNGII